MTKVWALSQGWDHEGESLYAIFSTEEKALAAKQVLDTLQKKYINYYIIISEVTIDEFVNPWKT